MSNLIEKFLIIVYIKRLSILIFTFRNEKDNGIEEEEKKHRNIHTRTLMFK